MNFDYNLEQLQNRAEVKFEAKRYAGIVRNKFKKRKDCDLIKMVNLVILFCTFI